MFLGAAAAVRRTRREAACGPQAIRTPTLLRAPGPHSSVTVGTLRFAQVQSGVFGNLPTTAKSVRRKFQPSRARPSAGFLSLSCVRLCGFGVPTGEQAECKRELTRLQLRRRRDIYSVVERTRSTAEPVAHLADTPGGRTENFAFWQFKAGPCGILGRLVVGFGQRGSLQSTRGLRHGSQEGHGRNRGCGRGRRRY